MKIKRGTVLLTNIPEWNMPHEKFAVVINENPDELVCACIINSEPSDITSKQEFQIKLSVNDYSFFKWDSYVDCSDIFRIARSRLEKGHLAVPKGTLNENDLNNVLNAGKSDRNIVMTPKKKLFFM
jgi:mRNA-degrading endonuclease toxin of MazEF toxin-antitoxin module